MHTCIRVNGLLFRKKSKPLAKARAVAVSFRFKSADYEPALQTGILQSSPVPIEGAVSNAPRVDELCVPSSPLLLEHRLVQARHID